MDDLREFRRIWDFDNEILQRTIELWGQRKIELQSMPPESKAQKNRVRGNGIRKATNSVSPTIGATGTRCLQGFRMALSARLARSSAVGWLSTLQRIRRLKSRLEHHNTPKYMAS
jgi:hypothetical protein